MKKFVLALVFVLMASIPASASESKETAFARIMRTGVIKCGYVIYEPNLMKDPNTGAFSGIVFDLMQEVAKRLSLKLEMTTESNFGSMGEDMKSGKSDLMCTSGWAYIPNVRAHLIVSRPVFYNALGAYVRKDDNRFTTIESLNDPSVTISAVDATVASVVAQENFSKAKVFSMPQTTPYDHNLLNVLAGKSDVTFVDPDYAERFLAKQKDKGALKNIAKDKPVRVFAAGILIPMGEVELEQMINISMEALLNEGFVDKVVSKYEASQGSILRVAPQYQIKR